MKLKTILTLGLSWFDVKEIFRHAFIKAKVLFLNKLSKNRYKISENLHTHNPLLKFPRNKQCFCNSGKKFKSCHLNKIPRQCLRTQAFEAKLLMEALGL